MEILLTVVFIGFVAYWIWSDNEKKKVIDHEIQRNESKKQEYFTKLATEEILIYQQFKSFFLDLFKNQESVSKIELNHIFDEKFKYYKKGEFEVFFSDLRNSGILSSVNYNSEDFFLGKGYYERERNFDNFENLIRNNKPVESGVSKYFDGLSNNNPTYFYNENYEIHYGFHFNLLSYQDFNKLFDQKIAKTTNFFLVTYFDSNVIDKKNNERKSNHIFKDSLEIKNDLSVSDYKKKLNEWYSKYLETISVHKESFGII